MVRGLSAFFLWLFCVDCISAAQETSSAVAISVRELRPALVLGSDRSSWLLRLSLRVSFRNDTSKALMFRRDQFQLFADGKSIADTQAENGDTFNATELPSGKSSEGWLWYSDIPLNGIEKILKLRWTSEESSSREEFNSDSSKDEPELIEKNVSEVVSPIEIDLNEVIRSLSRFESKSLGPEGELHILSVSRNLDILSTWALQEAFNRLSVNGVQRVILAPAPESKPVVSSEFTEWLSTMLEDMPGAIEQVARVPVLRSSARFKHISLAGFKEAAGRSFRNSKASIVQHRTVEDAVSAALTPLYRFVPVEVAIADLRNSDPGIRRAAMAGAVDRLTSEQASAIQEQARTGTERFQLEVASYLNLIPGSESVSTLRDLCLGENRSVAAVALRSLVRSHDDTAEVAMAHIWKTGESTPALQSEVVRAIVEGGDDRWAPLVADYVATYVQQATQLDSATIPGESVSGALTFLEKHNGIATLALVRQELVNIRTPAIQDMFLQHLLQTSATGNETVIRKCVTQRLSEGKLTPAIAGAASIYRDPLWTDALLEGFTQARDDSRTAPQYLHAAMECASHEQLDSMADDPDRFNISQQLALLQHLSHVNHPKWRLLAAEMMSRPGARSAEVIPLLSQDASEESLQLLRDRLEAYVAALEGTADASVEGQHFFQTLITHLAMFVHPECRRSLNRMARHPNASVRERVAMRQAEAERRAPGYHLLFSESKLRSAGKIEEANKALDDCLELNPLFPRAYLQRSSVAMHANRFKDAMADLEVADRLSPDDVDVQSMIALVMVRQDHIEKGLAHAESVIAMAPDDWTSLYNGACTFARATESQQPSVESRQKYADRAIELLRKTADLKFSDSEHMLNDADLLSLHQHSEWNEVVTLVNANKPAAPEAPKEDQ